MKLTELQLDTAAIDDGDWVPVSFLPGVKLKTRGTLCPGYRAAYDKAYNAALRAQAPNDQLAPEALEAIEAKCLLDECLMDWSGIENDDGTPLPFSTEQATVFLTDRTYRKVFLAARMAAQSVGQAVKKQTEVIAGN